tara:strand:- start:1399 stop:2316 length:918 start_codon:yes stop_codon:yes gene_type:complete
MTSKTVTIAEAQRLHNSQALNATFGDVQATCQSIINIESGIKTETAGLKDVSTTLFNQVRQLSKVTKLKAPDIFNHLSFLMGFDHWADKETGAPDLSGPKVKTGGGAWPKGKLSTYRAYIKKYEEVTKGPIHKAPDMVAVRDAIKPKKSDNILLDELRAYQSKDNKDFTDAQREVVDNKLHKMFIAIIAEERKAVQALKKAQEAKEAAEIAATAKAAKKEAAERAKVKKAEKAAKATAKRAEQAAKIMEVAKAFDAEKKLEASNAQSKPVKKQAAPAKPTRKTQKPDLGLLSKIAQGVGGNSANA